VRTLKTFQGTHILGASRGLLCDSYAVLSKVGLTSLLFRRYVTKKLVVSVGGPQQLGGPGQWPVWPVVKTALSSVQIRCVYKNSFS